MWRMRCLAWTVRACMLERWEDAYEKESWSTKRQSGEGTVTTESQHMYTATPTELFRTKQDYWRLSHATGREEYWRQSGSANELQL